MELTRRRFGWLLLAAAGALATGAWRCGAALRNAPWVRAVMPRAFPGRVVPFNRDQSTRVGRWAG
jgi:hypothetical protein